jgi:NAD(P)-dependent dehydrogenase (short-subunit alcohol dehydrogenase family)
MSTKRFDGKAVVVTGAAAGIGKSIALEFAREGANVAIGDVQIEKANAVAEEVKALGCKAVAVQTDVGDENQVQQLMDAAVEAFGEINILVNNAAVIHQAETVDTDVADWDRLIRNNLRSVFLCSKAAARQMIKQGKGGKIVSMSSIHAVLSEPQCCAYTAAKGGIEAFSRTLATELAPHKINVNCIEPGATYSELTTPMYTDAVKKALFQRVPMQEIAQPEWIARGVLFLASEDARYMTGSVMTMDGGYVMDGSLPGAKYWTE